jgi:hypothetical protein
MKKLIARYKLWKLKRKAISLHKLNNKQYFIIPVNNKGKIVYSLMNNDLHNAYNKQAKKMGKKQITYLELLKMAVFQTGEANLQKV